MKTKVNLVSKMTVIMFLVFSIGIGSVTAEGEPEYKVNVGDKKTYEIVSSLEVETEIEDEDGANVNVSTKAGDQFTIEVTKVETESVMVKYHHGDVISAEMSGDLSIFPVGDSDFWDELATSSTVPALNTTAKVEDGFFTLESDIWFDFLILIRTETKMKVSTETGWVEEFSMKITSNGTIEYDTSYKAVGGGAPGFELVPVLSAFLLVVPVVLYRKRK